jgi:hypothetical protein
MLGLRGGGGGKEEGEEWLRWRLAEHIRILSGNFEVIGEFLDLNEEKGGEAVLEEGGVTEQEMLG